MALRTRYSSLDMIRMAKFAKENQDLKPIPLIKAYNEKYPEVTVEQKLKNIRNWLDDNEVMAVAKYTNECEALPIQRVSNSVNCNTCRYLGKEHDAYCDNCTDENSLYEAINDC